MILRKMISLHFGIVLCAAGGCRVQIKQQDSIQLERGNWDLHDSMHPFSSLVAFGSASVSIEPLKPIPLSGFGGIGRRLLPPALNAEDPVTWQAPYEKVDIAPRAKVILFKTSDESQNERIVSILSIDVVGISKTFKRQIVRTLAQKFPSAQFNQSSVQLVATHTHSGPAGLAHDPLFEALAGDRFNDSYYELVEDRVVDAYRQAFDSMGTIISSNINHSIQKGFNASRLEGMSVDQRMHFVDFTSSNRHVCLVNFALHPTTFGQKERTLSPDIGGHIERAFESTFNAQECIFLPGTIGNATTRLGSRTRDEYSGELANSVLAENPTSTTAEMTRFAFGGIQVALPEAKLNAKGCELERATSMTSLKILEERDRKSEMGLMVLGDTAWIFLPGEPLQDLAQSIEKITLEALPNIKNVAIASVANDYIGYQMNQKTYDTPSLESCSALFPPSSNRAFKSAIVNLSRRLKL